MHKTFSIATVCAITLGAGAITLDFSSSDALAVDRRNLTEQQRWYCEQVERWRYDEMLGVEPKWRLGDPDSKGTYDQWCTAY